VEITEQKWHLDGIRRSLTDPVLLLLFWESSMFFFQINNLTIFHFLNWQHGLEQNLHALKAADAYCVILSEVRNA
jgi:hypothetical protein